MKTCPKCHLDYCDEFYFCEFDGISLVQVTSTEGDTRWYTNLFKIVPLLNSIKHKTFYLPSNISRRNLLTVISGFFILCVLVIYALKLQSIKTEKKISPVFSSSIKQTPLIVETPKEAIEYNEQSEESNLLNNQITEKSNFNQKGSPENNPPHRPGVTVYPQSKPIEKTTSERPENSSIMLPKSKLPNGRSADTYKADPKSDKPNTINQKPRYTLTPVTIPSRSSAEPSRAINQGIAIKLIRVLSKSTQRGIIFEITLNVHNYSGQLIQWENLTITAQDHTNKLTNTSPFFNRLGSPGNVVFTYKSPELYTSSTKSIENIQCTLVGRTINNSKVIASFSTSIH